MKERDLEQLKLRAAHDAVMGMETWLPVSFVAVKYGVSARRIRALLAVGRLKGRQLANGYWEVSFPPNIQMGRRGPQLAFLLRKRPKSRN